MDSELLKKHNLVKFNNLVETFKSQELIKTDLYINEVNILEQNAKNNVLIMYDRFLSKYADNRVRKELIQLLDNPHLDTKELHNKINDILPVNAPKHYVGFMVTELACIKKLKENPNPAQNLFLYSAKEADNHVAEEMVGYTAHPGEMLARSFETFIQDKSKNPQLLSDCTNVFLYPRGQEKSIYNDMWNEAFAEIKQTMGISENTLNTNNALKKLLKSRQEQSIEQKNTIGGLS